MCKSGDFCLNEMIYFSSIQSNKQYLIATDAIVQWESLFSEISNESFFNEANSSPKSSLFLESITSVCLQVVCGLSVITLRLLVIFHEISVLSSYL